MVSKHHKQNTHKKQWNILCENPGDCWKGPLRPTLRFYHALLRKNKEAEAEAWEGQAFWRGYEVGVALLVAGGNGRCGLCPQRDQWEILESSVGLGKIALKELFETWQRYCRLGIGLFVRSDQSRSVGFITNVPQIICHRPNGADFVCLFGSLTGG